MIFVGFLAAKPLQNAIKISDNLPVEIGRYLRETNYDAVCYTVQAPKELHESRDITTQHEKQLYKRCKANIRKTVVVLAL